MAVKTLVGRTTITYYCAGRALLREMAGKSQLLRSGEQMLKRGSHVATVAAAAVRRAVIGRALEHRRSTATGVMDGPYMDQGTGGRLLVS